MIYINTAFMQWFSKKQSTVERSVFGTEFVAMKKGIDDLKGLRYKVRMMRIPVSGPSCIFGNNMSVVHNTSRSQSVLRKKNNSVCYYAVCNSVAMGESLSVSRKKNISVCYHAVCESVAMGESLVDIYLAKKM